MYTIFIIRVLKIVKICPSIVITLVPLHFIINYTSCHIQSTVINPVLKMGRLRCLIAKGPVQGSAVGKWYSWYSDPD